MRHVTPNNSNPGSLFSCAESHEQARFYPYIGLAWGRSHTWRHHPVSETQALDTRETLLTL
jgi:hypothetical protein